MHMGVRSRTRLAPSQAERDADARAVAAAKVVAAEATSLNARQLAGLLDVGEKQGRQDAADDVAEGASAPTPMPTSTSKWEWTWNAAASSSDTLVTGLVRSRTSPRTLSVQLISSPAQHLCTHAQRLPLWRLFARRDNGIRAMYELNGAWAGDDEEMPRDKEDEVFHKDGRWIVLYEGESEGGADEGAAQSRSGSPTPTQTEMHTPVGFIMWRFDTESCTRRDGAWHRLRHCSAASDVSATLPPASKRPRPRSVTPCLSVGYVYEVHLLSPAYTSLGLGAALLDAVDVLSAQTGMSKVMLTTWRCNVRARRFYAAQGFELDGISLGDEVALVAQSGEEEEAEKRAKGYWILSRECGRGKEAGGGVTAAKVCAVSPSPQ